jgi:hypothetical protein
MRREDARPTSRENSRRFPAKDNGRHGRPVGFAVGEVNKQRLRLQGSGADKGFADDRRPDDQNWCGRRSELGLIRI